MIPKRDSFAFATAYSFSTAASCERDSSTRSRAAHARALNVSTNEVIDHPHTPISNCQSTLT
ncbi:hypothetical protein SNL152K_7003 [Streptomyces sp. NL15-2K]|nr:hypothetical protein SNL152K_7003 [Streptomyces sp. NL15-2K]